MSNSDGRVGTNKGSLSINRSISVSAYPSMRNPFRFEPFGPWSEEQYPNARIRARRFLEFIPGGIADCQFVEDCRLPIAYCRLEGRIQNLLSFNWQLAI